MEVLGQIIWSLFAIAIFIMLLLGLAKLEQSLLNYRVSPRGIDVMVAGKIRILQIRRENIREVKVTSGFSARMHSPFAFNFTNRFSVKVLFIRTYGRASYILSPDDPQAAIDALDLHQHG